MVEKGCGYDAASNRTLRRTRAGEDITLAYDALDRLLTRSVPANADAPAVTYSMGYDLAGRVLRLRQSTDAADVVYAYDTAGRLVSDTRPDGRVIGYVRDADGNATRLTWPETSGQAYQATDAYDPLGRVSGIFEGTTTTGLRLGGYAYDTASRRLSLERGNGARTTWGWRPDGLVQDLTHTYAGGASVAFTYLYNREGGLSARLVSDATYQASVGTQAATAYAVHAFNPYATVGAKSTRLLNGVGQKIAKDVRSAGRGVRGVIPRARAWRRSLSALLRGSGPSACPKQRSVRRARIVGYLRITRNRIFSPGLAKAPP